MKRRPVDPSIRSGPEDATTGPGASPDRFREALSHWASGVCIAAVRDPDDGRVYGTTVSSFGSVSAEPPRIMMSLGPGAQVLPFLDQGTRFALNILSDDQRRLASDYADSLPVGPSPFPAEGEPFIAGALARLGCSVEKIFPVDGARVVVALVVEADWETEESPAPLLHYRRSFRGLE